MTTDQSDKAALSGELYANTLKPCPFCGLVPKIILKDAPSNIIRCENNECSIRPSTGKERTWSMCVSVWNRRKK